MASIKIFVFLLVLKIVVSSQNVTITFKKVQLNKTEQNTLATLSQDRVMIGYQNGKLQIIDIENNHLNKSFYYFRNSVKSITVLDQNKVFVNDENKILMLDHFGQVLKKWQGQQKNKGVIVARNATGIGYMSVIKKKTIEEHIFENLTQAEKYINYFDTGQFGADFATYSPLHTHLYVVNNHKKKITVYDVTKTTVFDPKTISITTNNTLNQSNTSLQTSKSKTEDFLKSSQREAKNREMLKKVMQVMHDNKKNIIVERNYNFKIKQILTDYKQPITYNDALIMVTEDDIVYYTNKATITTFLPYKNHTSDELVSICFCQKVYLLILYRHFEQDKKPLFYLSFINKKTLISQKVLQLNSMFPDLKEIKAMDCNFKLITFLTAKSQLLIIENQYQQQKVQLISTDLPITYIQLGSTFILIAIFVCCCRRKVQEKEENQQDDQKQFQDQDQPEQINEIQNKKLDQSQKKTSENSSQEQTKIKDRKKMFNRDKLIQREQPRHKKNKKKLN